MKRIYVSLIKEHFKENRQMAFISGPRQAGKTTAALMLENEKDTFYLNWDDVSDREQILKGPDSIIEFLHLNTLRDTMPLLVFDEIHKYRQWKRFIKGFFDKYHTRCRIIVTGSSRLNVFRKGGDSLMGRVFHYRLHPLSLGELMNPSMRHEEINTHPERTGHERMERLLNFSGFPEPYLKDNNRFFNKWISLIEEQLIREDIRNLTGIQEISQIELLAKIISRQSGKLTSYSSLAGKVRVSVDTIRRWMETLQSFYFCFAVRPWSKNVNRSLLKEPKYYCWNWAMADDRGARIENFIASHLLKAVHFWQDSGMGKYGLYYLRDKEKREVDFLVARNDKPWFIVEAKSSENKLSPHLKFFQEQIKAEHAFQVAYDMEFVNRNCFLERKPVIVPALTFLQQLI